MSKKYLYGLVMACGILPANAQTVQVHAAIDSVDVMQGALRRVDVEVIQPSGMELRWTVDGDKELGKPHFPVEICPGVEVNSSSAIDTTDLGNDRLQLKRTLLVQPWDSGDVMLPPLALTNGTDTFVSNRLSIKVYTADVDTMTTIHSWSPVLSQKRGFFDWVPDAIADYWWAYLLGLMLIGGGIAFYIWRKRGGIAPGTTEEKKPVPPYERAIEQLGVLKSRQLCEKGQEKEYYTELTEILRQYLEGRFGINAMEMTTPQIKRAVRATVPADAVPTLMNEVLEMADYVKFAKMRPLPEDNVRAFNQAVTFVENTKPQPQPEAGKEAGK